MAKLDKRKSIVEKPNIYLFPIIKWKLYHVLYGSKSKPGLNGMGPISWGARYRLENGLAGSGCTLGNAGAG